MSTFCANWKLPAFHWYARWRAWVSLTQLCLQWPALHICKFVDQLQKNKCMQRTRPSVYPAALAHPGHEETGSDSVVRADSSHLSRTPGKSQSEVRQWIGHKNLHRRGSRGPRPERFHSERPWPCNVSTNFPTALECNPRPRINPEPTGQCSSEITPWDERSRATSSKTRTRNEKFSQLSLVTMFSVVSICLTCVLGHCVQNFCNKDPQFWFETQTSEGPRRVLKRVCVLLETV